MEHAIGDCERKIIFLFMFEESTMTFYPLMKEALFMTMNNAKEPSCSSNRKQNEENGEKWYNHAAGGLTDYTDSEIVTSVDFVFIEGEGWKLESEQ
jgi:hypothetical protein